ncbi:Surface-adhesin protein E-like domain-containing protein [Pararobbsia alpina]
MSMRVFWKCVIPILFIGIANLAHATKWVRLSDAPDLTFSVDTDSVIKDEDGYIDYLTLTTWKDPANPPGATAPVVSAVTRYKMDCTRRQSMAIDAHYVGADGAAAGVHSFPPNAWTPVAPGTVVDAIYSKIC